MPSAGAPWQPPDGVPRRRQPRRVRLSRRPTRSAPAPGNSPKRVEQGQSGQVVLVGSSVQSRQVATSSPARWMSASSASKRARRSCTVARRPCSACSTLRLETLPEGAPGRARVSATTSSSGMPRPVSMSAARKRATCRDEYSRVPLPVRARPAGQRAEKADPGERRAGERDTMRAFGPEQGHDPTVKAQQAHPDNLKPIALQRLVVCRLWTLCALVNDRLIVLGSTIGQ